jgi:hypothetical protein
MIQIHLWARIVNKKNSVMARQDRATQERVELAFANWTAGAILESLACDPLGGPVIPRLNRGTP